MTTYDLSSLIANLFDIRQRKNALEKTEDALLEQIKPLVDPRFNVLPKAPIIAGNLALSRSEGVRRMIQADLLLERGVAPDIIAYATKTSTYYQYRIKEQK